MHRDIIISPGGFIPTIPHETSRPDPVHVLNGRRGLEVQHGPHVGVVGAGSGAVRYSEVFVCGCGGEEEVEAVEFGGGGAGRGELAVAGGVDGDLEGVCVYYFFCLVGGLVGGEWMDGWTYLLRGEYRAVEHR